MSERFCSKCGQKLEPVFPEMARRQSDDQYRDCLHVILEGGYGEYVDNLIAMPHFRLCAECALHFLAENPWMRGAGL